MDQREKYFPLDDFQFLGTFANILQFTVLLYKIILTK